MGGCGGGGGGDDGGGAGAGGNAQALQAEIDQRFPFTPNQPFDVTFICGRVNSQLTYFFDFNSNQTFNVYITLDNGQDVTFSGTYTYANGVIRMVSLNNPILPLDETTTRIVPHMGMVGEFQTAGMSCGAQGHGYNDPAADTFKSYGCPAINVGPASYEENAFEFVHSAIPFSFPVLGSIFRQRDVTPTPFGVPGQAIITRGYGIYRRVGNTFYADFGNQFGDHNLLKGSFANGDPQMSVEQLSPGSGACNRR
jgi:hypothetical protein